MRIRRLVPCILPFVAGTSCASPRIELREAMNTVQRKYVILFDEVERGSNLETRVAARDLLLALEAPAIAHSPHAGDPEFQRLLAEAQRTAGRVEVEAESFDQEKLTQLRGEVSRTCRACHARFRATD